MFHGWDRQQQGVPISTRDFSSPLIGLMLSRSQGGDIMRTISLLLACVLPLAACNNGGEVHEENASIAEVQNKVSQAVKSDSFVQPGRWESRVTVEEMVVPGMGMDLTKQMQERTQAQTHSSCLTAEEAKRPKEDFFTGDNKNCRYDRFDMGSGKIDAAMKCTEGPLTQTVTLKGDYTPDAYNMQMAMQADGGQASAGGMRMKMRVDAKRVGECTGKES
jgi:hypothetical protein